MRKRKFQHLQNVSLSWQISLNRGFSFSLTRIESLKIHITLSVTAQNVERQSIRRPRGDVQLRNGIADQLILIVSRIPRRERARFWKPAEFVAVHFFPNI